MLSGGGRGTPVTHGVAVLSDRVAAGSLYMCRMGDSCRRSDNGILPDRWRADTYGTTGNIVQYDTLDLSPKTDNKKIRRYLMAMEAKEALSLLGGKE